MSEDLTVESIPGFNNFPIDYTPEIFNIIGPAVLVANVVGVFPNIAGKYGTETIA